MNFMFCDEFMGTKVGKELDFEKKHKLFFEERQIDMKKSAKHFRRIFS